MKQIVSLILILGLLICASAAHAQIIIGGNTKNGNLDATVSTQVLPTLFVPKPTVWQNVGTRTITGAYEDELSSESFAGQAPTPVTTGGSGLPNPDGCGTGNLDCGVFFKAFTGNTANGPATGHLFQDNPSSPGLIYRFTGWAGGEANFMAARAEFAIEFLNAGNFVIGGTTLNLSTAGLLTPNGQPFNYKPYTFTSTAPANTAAVRARASMIDGIPNPAGGGQAFVVDDITLAIVPEPTSVVLGLIAMLGAVGLIRRR
jgi:hypothetical protein